MTTNGPWESLLENGTLDLLTTTRTSNSSAIEAVDPFLKVYFILSMCDRLLTFTVNGVTIVSILRFSNLETPSNIFIFNLTVVDFLSFTIAPMEIILAYADFSLFYRLTCFVYVSAVRINVLFGALINLSIAIDRYYFIAKALEYHTIVTLRKATIGVVLTWVLSCSLVCVAVVFSEPWAFSSATCSGANSSGGKLFGVLLYVGFLTPTLVLYVKIALIANAQRRKVAALSYNVDNREKFKIAKVMGIVFAAFILSDLPILTWPLFSLNKSLEPRANRILGLLNRISNWINPFIYAWHSQDFRKAIRATFGCRNVVAPEPF